MNLLTNLITKAKQDLKKVSDNKTLLAMQMAELRINKKKTKEALKLAKNTKSEALIEIATEKLSTINQKIDENLTKREKMMKIKREIKTYETWWSKMNSLFSFNTRDIKPILGEKARLYKDSSIVFYCNKGSRWVLHRLENETNHEIICRAIKRKEEINAG